MNVLVVEPGLLPYEKEINGVAEIEKAVHGQFETIYPFEDNVAVVINANRENYRAGFNRSIPERQYGGIFGTFLVCGIEGEHFCSLTLKQMAVYRKRFEKAENLLGFEAGYNVFTQKVTAISKSKARGPRSRKKR